MTAFALLRAAIAVLAIAAAAPQAAHAQAVVDHLSAPGSITFAGVPHGLAWSSASSPGYFKQEYVPDGQTVERFEQMLLLEVLVFGADPATAAASQMKLVNARKGTDPVANAAILRNKASGEIILDFVLSAKTASGEGVVEWSAYRYVPRGKGVLMFGVSRRAYGDGQLPFMRSLKAERAKGIEALAAASIPSVTLNR